MNTQTFNIEDMANAEHLVLETGVHERIELENSAPLDSDTLTVRDKRTVKDWVRNAETQFVLYNQGQLKLKETQRGKEIKTHQLQLRYLDPVPTLNTHLATRLLYAAAACAGVAVLAILLGQFAMFAVAASVCIAAVTACCVTLLLAAHCSYQCITFHTLHGRSAAIQLKASVGSRRRMRELLPFLSSAIEEAAETIGNDTAVFLREEMREHYRLRSDGVLTPEDCDNGTGHILAQFDGPL